jgi:hypothetical protein
MRRPLRLKYIVCERDYINLSMKDWIKPSRK